MGLPNKDQHETSQRSTQPFRNDRSSENEAIMRRKELEALSAAALAAKEAQKELERTRREESEAAARELETLRNEKAEVERLKGILQSQCTTLEAKVSKLQGEKEVLTKTGEMLKNNLEAEVKLNQDYQTKLEKESKELRITKSSLQSELDKILPSFNCLDPRFHNTVVRIINWKAHVAFDLSAKEDSKIYVVGWNSQYDNSNQILRLEKTNTSDPKSPWTIRRHDSLQYLEFTTEREKSRMWVYGKRQGSEQTWQHWYIGREPSMPTGTYFIRNVKFDRDVRIEKNVHENGKSCYPGSTQDSTGHTEQQWVICPQEKYW